MDMKLDLNKIDKVILISIVGILVLIISLFLGILTEMTFERNELLLL